MTWPNGTAVEETIKALKDKLTATEARLAEAERRIVDLLDAVDSRDKALGFTEVRWEEFEAPAKEQP